MAYLIGTDEAGYGPNLGPLVISATVWESPDDVGGEDLFERLSHAITQEPGRAAKNGGGRVAMADSKRLYKPGQGLHNLERGLFAALALLSHRPQTWRGVWQILARESLDDMQSIPWYAKHDMPAPLDCTAEQVESAIATLQTGLASAGVRLAAVQSRAVFEPEFNDLVERHESKGAALSHQTLALAARVMGSLPEGPISLICDKHGGRDRYGPLLQRHFPEWLIEVRGEGRARSDYRFGPPERRVSVCFRTKAESCLPAALASMASKYLRELAMHAFNDYWRCHVPDLQPTAGYPQDAKRFRADIAKKQEQLRISDRILWRMR